MCHFQQIPGLSLKVYIYKMKVIFLSYAVVRKVKLDYLYKIELSKYLIFNIEEVAKKKKGKEFHLIEKPMEQLEIQMLAKRK